MNEINYNYLWERERKRYIPSVTSIDILSLLLTTAANIEWILLCLHWSSIILLRGDITMHMCYLDCCNVSKIKGGNKKQMLLPKPVGKTPTVCFFWSRLSITETCSSLSSNENLWCCWICSVKIFLTSIFTAMTFPCANSYINKNWNSLLSHIK